MNKQNIINPSNGEVIAQVAIASRDDVERAIRAAREAFDGGPWPKISLAERKNYLLRIAQGISEKSAELAKLETLNTGKPIKETTFMDVPSAAKTFEHFANHLEKYLAGQDLTIREEAQAKLVYEPYGVALLIVPWNYPLLIASWKLAQALAAGNTVILKPSSLTPLTALELGKIAQEAGLPSGVVNVINGSGEEIGELLCSDKRVDMISFTGSNEVGRRIMTYASKNVKKLLMELGGKSASIICKDVDLDVAVNSALTSIFLNQGQMCTAMSRILIEDDIYDKFVANFVAKAKKIKLGGALDHETQLGPLVSVSQRKRVLDFVEKAKKEGAKLLCGGNIPENPALSKGFFFEPAVFVDVRPEMSIFKEEIFGPVACLSKFSSIEEAISLTNTSDFGLACSIWTKNQALAQDIAAKINAGTIWINTYGMFYNEVPFGGFKQSGFGKELGRAGLLEYCRLKNIITDKSKEGKPLVSYWYGF